ncbi:hypothetical protein P4C99_18720 [Pontiellaceae bacterium B1224]|nr:hypothetical protein [Pontiellaceae bacterium B1224]
MNKTVIKTLTVLAAALSTSLANFSGGDDFNDNSMDTNKWAILDGDADRYLVQAGGRLEARATPGVNDSDSGVWEWIANDGKYTEDWSVTYETTINMDETSISDYVWVGFVVLDPTLSSEVYLEYLIGPGGGGERFAGAGVSSLSPDYYTSFDVTNQTVSLKATYDADSKKVYTWYSEGGPFMPIGSSTVTNWGMSEGDQFRLVVFGGGEGEAISSGQVYGDNLKLVPYIGTVPPNEDARIPCSSIVGSWAIGDPTTKDTVIITFLEDGQYFLAHEGEDLASGLGMERGTYMWNEITGIFQANTTVDTNGEGGLSHPSGSPSIIILGNTLNYITDRGNYQFERIYQPSTPPSIVGGWVHVDTGSPSHDNVVFTFLPNGIYFFAQDGDSTFDPSGQDGMERGVYSADPNTGELLFTAITDTCGEWGPDDPDPFSYVVNGNTLTLNGGFELHRIVDADCSDIDGDGLPDSFEQLYYGNQTNGIPTANNDDDSLTDREEFIAGTLPNDASSQFVVSNAPPSPSGMVINWNAIEGRTYSVKWTDSLTNVFQTLETGILYPQNSYTDTVHSAEGDGFYQADVQLGD